MGGASNPPPPPPPEDDCDYPAWQAGATYYPGDIVIYQDAAYVCVEENPGYDPVISNYFWDPYDCDFTPPPPPPPPVDPVDCPLNDVVGSANFYAMHSTRRNSFYTYEALCQAILDEPGFWGFANSGNADTDKREAAAFFANVSRETGELEYIEQIVKDPPVYFGRGPIQITHDFNYSAAGAYLGIDLLNNPALVATDPVVTWKTALWFWMVYNFNGNCHDSIVAGNFGATIRIINGGFECNGPNEAAQQRIDYYLAYTSRFGTSPGSQLQCW
jgi:chitinase